MENKYLILTRYEHRVLNGITWTKWFPLNTHCYSKNEADELIEKNKEDFIYIDKKTKLKHEYTLKLYDEYINEQKANIDRIKKLEEESKAYYKSDKYKELQKKKRQAAKERKERQKKYLEEHEMQAISKS